MALRIPSDFPAPTLTPDPTLQPMKPLYFEPAPTGVLSVLGRSFVGRFWWAFAGFGVLTGLWPLTILAIAAGVGRRNKAAVITGVILAITFVGIVLGGVQNLIDALI